MQRQPTMHPWTADDIPPQTGRLAVVTGGSDGLGYEIALALARAGSDVILAGRDGAKARAALGRIRSLAPLAVVRFERLDLSNLASVADFSVRLAAMGVSVDLLVNNAGVMASGKRQVTADGFEMQLGSNYLGHFALTARLLPLLRRSGQARVVQLSSLAHRHGSIHFDDLQLEHQYKPLRAYCQSKLAMLMFALELQRRSDRHGWGLMSTAAHPGYPRTGMMTRGPAARNWLSRAALILRPFLSQPAAAGALPALFAATAKEVRPGWYYGPTGIFEMKGPAGWAAIDEKARDPHAARRLWEASEKLTGVRWPQG
jgi:NAD(P)-dependent dehydrogenase (short-subunit alcohol dehydrogenase family)